MKNKKFLHRKITGKILSILLSVIMLLALYVPVQANNLSYYATFKSIKVSGYGSLDSANPFVTLILKNGDEIIGLGETKMEPSGKYEYTFRAPKITEGAELFVKCADQDITSTVYEAILETSTIAQVSYDLVERDNTYEVTADLSDVTELTDNFTIVVAQYDKEERLVESTLIGSDELEDISLFDGNIEKKSDILKLYVWTTDTMAAAAKTREGDGGLLLKFGAKADSQYKEGYKPLAGNNGYERYLQAKSELPEELDIIKEQKPQITNAFYVSSNALSGGDGSFDRPFATLEDALDAYRNLSNANKENWTGIYLFGGVYNIDEIITINNTYTNSEGNAKLYIGAYNGEKVTFTNGKTVTGDDLIPVTKENTSADTINRIHSNAGQIYYVDYETLGIDKISGAVYGDTGKKPKLYISGKEQILARYPNGSDTYISNVINDGYNNGYLDYAVFVPTDTRPFEWTNQANIGIAGQLSVSWYYNHMQAYFDNDLNHISVPATQAAAQKRGIAKNLINATEIPSHFHYYNVFEEMDLSGEWCYDDTEKRVYICLDGDVSDKKISVAGDMTSYAIQVSGISNVVFDGIDFEVFQYAVRISGCSDVVVQNSTFKNLGRGMYLTQSETSGVINSDFENVYTGIYISGGGASASADVEPKRNFVQNCHFDGVENDCMTLSYTFGNIVSHNLAENFKGWFTGVFYGGENIIEYNEAYAGGYNGSEDYIIYLNGTYESRANHIRYNYLHDFSPLPQKIPTGVVICADDLAEEQYIYGNIIQNAYSGIYGNGGDNNVIDSNYIISSSQKNLWASIRMSNSMYGANVGNMGEQLLNNPVNALFTKTYHSLKLAQGKWGQRYPHATDRMTYLQGVSKTWNTGDKISEDMLFARLCTGNYIINNVGVNVPNFAINNSPQSDDMNGDGVSDVTDVSNMFVQNTDPAISVTQDEYGNDYNVMWNNTYPDSVDLSQNNVFLTAGLEREKADGINSQINVLYPKNSNIRENANTVEVCWDKENGVNFYQIVVASDAAFTNVISDDWFIENRGTIDLAAPNKESMQFDSVREKGEITLLNSISNASLNMVVVKDSQGNTVTSKKTLTNNRKTITFSFDNSLKPGEIYTVQSPVRVDGSGNVLATKTFTFVSAKDTNINKNSSGGTLYYYKVLGYSASEGDASLAAPIVTSDIRTIEKGKQQIDVTVISKGDSNLSTSWEGALGNNQTRAKVNGLLSQMTDDGYYVRFTGPAATSNETYRMVWDGVYSCVESETKKYDPDFYTNVSLKVRFPSEAEFATYADVAMAQWYPSFSAENVNLGGDSNEVKLIFTKTSRGYSLELYDFGRRNPNTLAEESRILLKTYNSPEKLFGRWIDINYTVDMLTGVTTGTADGVNFETDQNNTSWGERYKWNPENYLRFFDFALKTNTDNVFTMDVKDVIITRSK